MTTWDLVITAGQSQMVGHAYVPNAFFGNPAPPPTNPALCQEWDGSALVDVEDQVPPQNIYTGHSGSSIPQFCNTFTAGSGTMLVVVRSAIDGTALLAANAGSNDDWSPTGGLFADSVARASGAIAAGTTEFGEAPRHVFVIWSQGGKDAAGGNGITKPDPSTQSDYALAQTDLLARYRTALGIPTMRLYIEKMYRIPGINSANCDKVVVAQGESVAASGGDISFGFESGDTFTQTNKELIADNVHYAQAGLNIMGQSFASHILPDLGISAPPPPEPPANISPTSIIGILLLRGPKVPPLPREFTTAGTFSWKCPQGVTSVDVEAWGAGAGGGSGRQSQNGGGGGGGAYARNPSVAVTPGNTYTVVVGAGGVGVSLANGTNGGASSFATTTVVAAGGSGGVAGALGVPGAGGAGGTTAASTGTTETAGANGAAGNAGGTGGTGANGGVGGAGGNPPIIGTAPGGGGGGGHPSSPPGAAGAVGKVRIS